MPVNVPRVFIYAPDRARWVPYLWRCGIGITRDIDDSVAALFVLRSNTNREAVISLMKHGAGKRVPLYVLDYTRQWDITWIGPDGIGFDGPGGTRSVVAPFSCFITDTFLMNGGWTHIEGLFARGYIEAIDGRGWKQRWLESLLRYPYRRCGSHLDYIREVPFGPYRVDFMWPNEKVIVECDGVTYHSDPDRVMSDKKRDRYFSSRGWLTLRYSTPELEADAVGCANEVIDILLKRTPA